MFLSITPLMLPDEHKWNISLVKERYSYLDLTDRQAEQVFAFETNNGPHSGKHFFTSWEEWDYELHFFSRILDKEQLKKYSRNLRKRIRWHQKGLTGYQEAESSKRIDYYSELISYYEEKIVPHLINLPIHLETGIVAYEQSKIELLKAEYKKFLQETRRECIIHHFKNYRTFCAITLKSTLLSRKLFYLLPDYQNFKFSMDEPTKATAAFLESHIHLTQKTDQLLQDKFAQAAKFNRELTQKYHPEIPVYTYGKSSPEEDQKQRGMILVLMDKDQYGWNEFLLT